MTALRLWLLFLTFAAACLWLASAVSHAAPVRQHHHRHHAHVRPKGAPVAPSFWSATGSDLVTAARSEIGNGAVYGRRNLWCARFVNVLLARTGHHGTGSDLARSFLAAPHTSMRVGTIAVMSHHVGVVSAVTAAGDPVIISGNNGGRVREGAVSRGRVLAFVEVR